MRRLVRRFRCATGGRRQAAYRALFSGCVRARRQATLGRDGTYVFVCTPEGTSIQLKTGRFAASELQCTWFNPGTGEHTPIRKRQTSEVILECTPPGRVERGNDRVLVVDAVNR